MFADRIDKKRETQKEYGSKVARLVPIAALIFICVLPLAGCGRKIPVTIQDGYTQTRIEAAPGQTVSKIIRLAEIELDTEDKVEPAPESAVSDAGTVIKISRRAVVDVDTGEKTSVVTLTGKTVADALDEAGVSVDENDLINHEQKALLEMGMTINVQKRYRVIATINQEKKEYLTDAGTVGDFLKKQGITVQEGDVIKPETSHALSEGLEITVRKKDIKEETRTEKIKYKTKVEYSDEMYEGTSKVTTKGVYGKKEVTYRVTYIGGKKSEEVKTGEKIVKKPVDEVITKGTKKKEQTPQKRHGKTVVSKQAVYDCDGSGHGYYIYTFEDGSEEYEDF